MGSTILHHALAAAWPILASIVIVAWSQARASGRNLWTRLARPGERPGRAIH